MRALRIDWRTALIFVTRDPSWKRRIGLGGLLMLVAPPIGWLTALGYRSLVGNRLVDGRSPVLPDWRHHIGAAFARGAASSGVILAYLSPVFVAYWVAGVGDPNVLRHHWRDIALFAAAVVAFPPLAIPAMPVAYALRYDWLQFSGIEIAGLVLACLAVIFTLPAAFLQVARHRRFRAAFKVRAAIRLMMTVPRLYVEAWIISLTVSAIAVLLVPLAPWLLFWSYLVISHVFLQALGALRTAEAAQLAEARV